MNNNKINNVVYYIRSIFVFLTICSRACVLLHHQLKTYNKFVSVLATVIKKKTPNYALCLSATRPLVTVFEKCVIIAENRAVGVTVFEPWTHSSV